MKIKNALASISGTSLIFFARSASAQSQVPVTVGSTRQHLETLVAKLSCFMSLLLVVSTVAISSAHADSKTAGRVACNSFLAFVHTSGVKNALSTLRGLEAAQSEYQLGDNKSDLGAVCKSSRDVFKMSIKEFVHRKCPVRESLDSVSTRYFQKVIAKCTVPNGAQLFRKCLKTTSSLMSAPNFSAPNFPLTCSVASDIIKSGISLDLQLDTEPVCKDLKTACPLLFEQIKYAGLSWGL